MRFLVDESCDYSIVRELRAAGYDIAEIRIISPGASDNEVIEVANNEARILLTEDKDFGQLFFASSDKPPGVILIRFPANARKNITQSIIKFINDNAVKIKGNFVVIQPGRIRISKPLK